MSPSDTKGVRDMGKRKDRPMSNRPCDIMGCTGDGRCEGYYPRSFSRPGRMCPQHAYDPRNGFLPRPYSVRDHDRYYKSLV